MKRILNIPSLYVLLWMLYNTQGLLFDKGSIVSQVILLLFLGVSMYGFWVVNRNYLKGPYLKALNIMIIMFFIYGLLYMMFGGFSNKSFEYLKLILLSLLPVYLIYLYTINGIISIKWIRYVSCLLLIVCVYNYFVYRQVSYANSTTGEIHTINVGYEFLSLLPLAFFWKKRPLIQYLFLAVVVVFVLSTGKRGAIIIMGVCLLLFLFTNQSNVEGRKKYYIWLLTIVFVIVGFRFVSRYYSQNEYLQHQYERIQNGDSSGRDEIYSNALNVFSSSGFTQQLIGHGANGTIREMKYFAHNDWLEILVNQGLLGVFVFFVYWISFIIEYRKRIIPLYKPCVLTIIIILFGTSLVSMSYNSISLSISIALGYCLAVSEWKGLEIDDE